MADPLSVAASIAGIATAGIQVSIKIVTLAGQVSTASDRISAIGNDVSLTSGILHQLGELTNQKAAHRHVSIFNKEGLETTKNSAEVCRRIFEEVERETSKASELIRRRKHQIGGKVKLSMVEKAKWPFLQPGLEILRTDLREAKNTLMLMLQVASLALSQQMSKQMADFNASSSAEQKDTIHSIYILQQQQQQQQRKSHRKESNTASNRKTDVVRHSASQDEKGTRPLSSTPGRLSESLATKPGSAPVPISATETGKTELFEAKRPDRAKQVQSIPEEDADRIRAEDAISLSGRKSPQASAQMSSQEGNVSGIETPQGFSPSNSTSQDPNQAIDSKGSNDAEKVELRMYSIDPMILVYPARVEIDWAHCIIPISQSEIRGRLAKNQTDGLPSVLDTMETLQTHERLFVSQGIKNMFAIDQVDLLSLQCMKRDLQQEGMGFKALPSFLLIVQLHRGPSQWGNSRNPVMDLIRPTYVKVHRKHLCPETLDIYELPWEWDKRDSNYIVIKRWIPEHDQDILFEHTRQLKERNKMANATVEPYALKNGQDRLLLVRKKSSDRARGRNRKWFTDSDSDSRSRSSSRMVMNDDAFSTTDSDESPTEDEQDEQAHAGKRGVEPREMAAVNELLEKYTTVFEQAPRKRSWFLT